MISVYTEKIKNNFRHFLFAGKGAVPYRQLLQLLQGGGDGRSGSLCQERQQFKGGAAGALGRRQHGAGDAVGKFEGAGRGEDNGPAVIAGGGAVFVVNRLPHGGVRIEQIAIFPVGAANDGDGLIIAGPV